MIRIKLCGLSRENDIFAANALMPEYVGFVFWPKSRRYASPETAETLKKILVPEILSVGVFVDEDPENIAAITQRGIIDIIQLHGHENEEYIYQLRTLSGKNIIKAFKSGEVRKTSADYVMIDSGMGTGKTFDWSACSITQNITSPLFIAGGLTPENAAQAIQIFHPFAVDVSSGIETNGVKDIEKMTAFVEAVRKETL